MTASASDVHLLGCQGWCGPGAYRRTVPALGESSTEGTLEAASPSGVIDGCCESTEYGSVQSLASSISQNTCSTSASLPLPAQRKIRTVRKAIIKIMGSIATEVRCKAICEAWNCNSLEKAEGFLSSQASGAAPLELENFVSNQFSPSTQHLDAVNPKTGKVFARVPVSSAEQVDEAVKSATEAFKTWSKTTVAVRSKHLQRIAQLIQENHELFAVWESLDQGKTLARARVEVDRAISNFK
jgi:delta 1-pyrroline-5-carboxylate dehydrogenase